MKKLWIGLTALTLTIGLLAFVRVAAQQTPEETHIKGKIVCKTCYLRDKSNVGQAMDYEDLNEGEPELCAVHCAVAGRPLALLTDDGKLYTITGKLAEPGNVRSNSGNKILRENVPYRELQRHFTHVLDLFGTVTEKKGELEIAANRFVWATGSKDWQVGGTTELKAGEEGGIYKDGKPVK